MSLFPRKYLLLLFLFSLPLFFINIHDGHSWGDDFSMYIKEAQNFAQGKPFYQTQFIFNKYNSVYSPPQYPPGFPLMLAPVVKIWGLSFRPMFYFISLLTACLLFVVFAYFKKRQLNDITSLCLTILVVYNSVVLDVKGSVLADIPCMLFVALYLTARKNGVHSWRRILLLVLFAVLAIQIRSQAVFLLLAEAVYWVVSTVLTFIREKKFSARRLITEPSLVVITGVLVSNLFISKVIFSTPSDTTAFYNNFIREAMQGSILISAKDNAYYLLKTISGYFYYPNGNGFLNAAAFFAQSAGLVFAFIGFLLSLLRRLTFDHVFFAVMCMVILFYPVHDTRYFLPALPILLYYCFIALEGFVAGTQKVQVNKVLVAVTVLYLLLGINYVRKLSASDIPGLIPGPGDKEAFSYISQHVDSKDAIVFAKPRALTLFTDRKTTCVAWQVSPRENKRIFDSMHVRYILVIKGYEDSYFNAFLDTVQRPVDSVHLAGNYMLYSLH